MSQNGEGDAGDTLALRVRIREFSMADYEAVYGLWSGAGPGLALRPSDEREQVALKLTRDPDLFLVAEVEQRVVGVIVGAWDGRRGWLHHLAVEPTQRGQGIGSALLREVERRLKAKGCLKINLLVRCDNEAAQRLYQRLGYEPMTSIIAMGKEL